MGVVRVLSEHVQNQIAAGEVVERPASVVKELAENSLDAGATRIDIDIEDGGQRLIRVVDNGKGMDPDDLLRCVERHATSKIATVDDIFHISTMGFRGEALPSVASVSRMEIVSARPGDESGHALVIEAGKVERLTPCAARVGTVVTVRDLFHNTPARRKFMRQSPAESHAVSVAVVKLSLANPGVAFRLATDARELHNLPARESAGERIADLYASKLADQLVGVEYAGEGVRIGGFVAKPPESRPNSTEIFLFLNRRWIRHPGMARVVADCYRGRLPPRRYPFAVLYIEVDPDAIDVNVHPAKEEVRFNDERRVIGTLRRAVESALREADYGDPAATSPWNPVNTGPVPAKDAPESPWAAPVWRLGIEPQVLGGENGAPVPGDTVKRLPEERDSDGALRVNDDRVGKPPTAEPVAPAPSWRGAALSSAPLPPSAIVKPVHGEPAPAWPRVEPPKDSAPAGGVRHEPATPEPKTAPDPAQTLGITAKRHRVLGQAGDKYLVVEGPDGLLLVDPHALHERWNYERLRGRLAAAATVKLLLPVVVAFPPTQELLAEMALEPLRAAGFEVELAGKGALAVSAAPEFMRAVDIERLVRDAIMESGGVGRAVAARRENMLASLACRSAVLLGKALPEEEVTALLDLLWSAKEPPTCPHGRPSTVLVSWSELTRRFGR